MKSELEVVTPHTKPQVIMTKQEIIDFNKELDKWHPNVSYP